MAEAEVTAQWHGLQCQLGIEQGVAVVTALLRVGGEHGGIAGQFLVMAHPRQGVMQQRVAPAQAAQQRGGGIRPVVATRDVALFVGQYQRLLGGIETGCEVHRQHDLRAQQAQRGRQPGLR